MLSLSSENIEIKENDSKNYISFPNLSKIKSGSNPTLLIKIENRIQELKSHFERCRISETGKSTLPFISRELNRLKIMKKISLKKNKSTLNELSNDIDEIKHKNKQNNVCKIYRYYFSKNKIEEILMNQRINKLRQDLNKKQENEKNEYDITFHRKYPSENESEYKKELQEILKNEKIKENLEKIRKKYLEKKHEEYIAKMGIEFEKGFNILNKKFIKEKEEQNIKIKKIILNRRIKQMEKTETKDNFDNRNKNKQHFYFSQYNFSNIEDDEKRKKKEKELENLRKRKFGSRIFSFSVRGKLYKTIII